MRKYTYSHKMNWVKMLPFAILQSFLNVWILDVLISKRIIPGDAVSMPNIMVSIILTVVIYAILGPRTLDLIRNNRGIDTGSQDTKAQNMILIETICIVSFFTGVILLIGLYLLSAFLGKAIL